MAEISDDRFKDEMMRMMKTAILKIGDNSKEINLLRKDFDKNTRELKNVKKESQVNSDELDDVMFRVLKMRNRLFDIEKQLKTFNERLIDVELEMKQILSELYKVSENFRNNAEARIKLDELNLRIEKLEEAVFTV